MLKRSLTIFLFCVALSGQAQELILNVENLKNQEGQLIITLFANAQDFLKKPVYERYVSLDDLNQRQLILADVPKGEYALCIVHDQNQNGDIDTNFLKIPKESYGFSHNPKSKFGPPPFDRAKFAFYGKTELTVLLN